MGGIALPGSLFTAVANVVAASPLVHREIRRVLLRWSGIRIGRSVVASRCSFGSPRVSIGEDTFVNTGVFFDGSGQITVGSNVHLAMEVMLLTGGHELGDEHRRGGAVTTGEIVIGDGVWVGARAVVLPGVTIGRGSVVGAGAVVTRSCEPNAVYAGNPARKIRDLGHRAGG